MSRDLSIFFYPPGQYDAHVRERDRQRVLQRFREWGKPDPEAHLDFWCQTVFRAVSRWAAEDAEDRNALVSQNQEAR